MPGGDDFGARPIDMHIAGLEAMGATFKFAHGELHATCDRLHGADIAFPFPSVGATENIVTSAVFAKGTTTIDNAAREPEVVDLCDMLVKMGADIEGIGTSRLVIHGVERGALTAAGHRTVARPHPGRDLPRRRAVTGGELEVRRRPAPSTWRTCSPGSPTWVSSSSSADGSLRVAAQGRLRSIDVPTLPYPGIATDYKPLIITMLSVADGAGIVTENLYPGRFRYVEELIRLGANIRTTGHHAVVRGVPRLSGRAGQGPRHPGRGRDGGRRPGRRGRHDDQRRRPHRPGLRRPRRPARRGRRRHRTRLSRPVTSVGAGRAGSPAAWRATAATTRPASGRRRAAPRPNHPDVRSRSVIGRQRTDRCRIGHAGGMPGDETEIGTTRDSVHVGEHRSSGSRSTSSRGSTSRAAGSSAPTSCSSTCATTCRGRPASCTATTTSSRSVDSARRGGGGARCRIPCSPRPPAGCRTGTAPTSTGSA